MRFKGSGVLGIAAVSAALVLSGCSDGGGTTPDSSGAAPTSSAAPETTAPPTPKPATSTSPAENIEPPVMPEEAKEFTAEGYEAFVNYWFEAHNYAYMTGDYRLVESASLGECQYCSDTIRLAQATNANDGWQFGGDVTISDFYTPMSESSDGTVDAVFTFNQSFGAAYNADGSPNEEVGEIPEFTLPFTFWATYESEVGWKAAKIEPVQ